MIQSAIYGRSPSDMKVICDGCGDVHVERQTTFDDIRSWMRENGWRTVKASDKWENLCPGCGWKK